MTPVEQNEEQEHHEIEARGMSCGSGDVLQDSTNEVRNAINHRFCEAVNFLIEQKMAHNKNEIMASLGLYLGRLSLILGDRANASTDNLAKLVAKYYVSPEYLLLGTGPIVIKPDGTSFTPSTQAQMESNALPLIPLRALAGYNGIDEPGVDIASCPRYVVPEFKSAGADFLIKIAGNSMVPTFNSGDMLACKKVSATEWIEFGEAYVIDGMQGIMVKRLYNDPDDLQGKFQCRSDNKEVAPFSIPKSEVRSISKVLGVIRCS